MSAGGRTRLPKGRRCALDYRLTPAAATTLTSAIPSAAARAALNRSLSHSTAINIAKIALVSRSAAAGAKGATAATASTPTARITEQTVPKPPCS